MCLTTICRIILCRTLPIIEIAPTFAQRDCLVSFIVCAFLVVAQRKSKRFL
jgi:hypothetical protein